MAAKNMDEIAALLEGLRFRKKMFGGIDERDVWKKLEMLQKEYRSAFEAQQERSKALLEERDHQIRLLKEKLSAAEQSREDSHG